MRPRSIRSALIPALLPAVLLAACAARRRTDLDSLPAPCGSNYVACRNGCPLEDTTCEDTCLTEAEACAKRVTGRSLPIRRCANDQETCGFNCESTFIDNTRERDKCLLVCEDRFRHCLEGQPVK